MKEWSQMHTLFRDVAYSSTSFTLFRGKDDCKEWLFLKEYFRELHVIFLDVDCGFLSVKHLFCFQLS